MTENPDVANMNIAFGDPNTATGNYMYNTIDIGDVAQWPQFDHSKNEQDGATQGGKMLHETREQFNKAASNIPYGSDRQRSDIHDRAVGFEDRVNGNTRGVDLKTPGYQEGVIESFKKSNGTTVRYQVIGGQYSTARPIIIVKPYNKK
jgi:hypothetical protein